MQRTSSPDRSSSSSTSFSLASGWPDGSLQSTLRQRTMTAHCQIKPQTCRLMMLPVFWEQKITSGPIAKRLQSLDRNFSMTGALTKTSGKQALSGHTSTLPTPSSSSLWSSPPFSLTGQVYPASNSDLDARLSAGQFSAFTHSA